MFNSLSRPLALHRFLSLSNKRGRAENAASRAMRCCGFYFECLRVDALGRWEVVATFLSGFLPSVGSFFGFVSSTLTAAIVFAISTLYRAAVRARFESLARDCLGS